MSEAARAHPTKSPGTQGIQPSQLDAVRQLFERAVDTAAACRRIVSVEDPVIYALTHDETNTQTYGKVPAWEDIQPSEEELRRIQRLESPIAVVSTPGVPFDIQTRTARRTQAALQVISSFHPEDVNKGNFTNWNPQDPKNGLSQAELLARRIYTHGACDIILVDGGDDVPRHSLFLTAFEFAELCQREGFTMPDLHTQLALHLEGRRSRKTLDRNAYAWVDGYLKQQDAPIFSRSNGPDISFFFETMKRSKMPNRGGRRAVRLTRKTQEAA